MNLLGVVPPRELELRVRRGYPVADARIHLHEGLVVARAEVVVLDVHEGVVALAVFPNDLAIPPEAVGSVRAHLPAGPELAQ